jgi:hypothetical protein
MEQTFIPHTNSQVSDNYNKQKRTLISSSVGLTWVYAHVRERILCGTHSSGPCVRTTRVSEWAVRLNDACVRADYAYARVRVRAVCASKRRTGARQGSACPSGLCVRSGGCVHASAYNRLAQCIHWPYLFSFSRKHAVNWYQLNFFEESTTASFMKLEFKSHATHH